MLLQIPACYIHLSGSCLDGACTADLNFLDVFDLLFGHCSLVSCFCSLHLQHTVAFLQ
jgi:hypothetical protein